MTPIAATRGIFIDVGTCPGAVPVLLAQCEPGVRTGVEPFGGSLTVTSTFELVEARFDQCLDEHLIRNPASLGYHPGPRQHRLWEAQRDRLQTIAIQCRKEVVLELLIRHVLIGISVLHLRHRLNHLSTPRSLADRASNELFSRNPSTLLRDFGGRKVPMQHLGVEPQAVRPDHGSRLCIDSHLPEEAGVFERLEHLAPEVVRETDLAGHPIVEGQPEPVFGQRLDSGDAEYHGLSLRQRIDGIQLAPFAGLAPTLVKLGLPEPRPFAHEAQGPRRQEALSHLPAHDRQLGPMLAVLRMEVRGKVVLPVHPYDRKEVRAPRPSGRG